MAKVLCLFIILVLTPIMSSADTSSLEPVSVEQQKAISELVNAMKHIPKARNRSNGSTRKQQEQSLFKDSQEFKMPEFKPEDSMEQKLEQISQEQQEVLDNLDKGASPKNSGQGMEKASGKQSDMLAKLKKMTSDPSAARLPDVSRKMLDDALVAGGEAARAMDSNNRNIARLKAGQSNAYVNDVIRRLRQESDCKQNAILDNVQKELNAMEKQNGSPSDTKTEQKLREMAEKIKQHALEQHRSGRGENARELAELARDLAGTDKVDKPGAAERLKQLKKNVAELRSKRKGASGYLEKSLKKIKEYQKQMEFLKKHPDAMSDLEKKELLKNIELAMQDAVNAIEKAQKNKARPNTTKGKRSKINPKTAEELNEAMRKAMPNYNPRLFNSGSNAERLHLVFRDLLISGKAALSTVGSGDRVFQFKNDEVPEKYRLEVAKYFESLSDSAIAGDRKDKK